MKWSDMPYAAAFQCLQDILEDDAETAVMLSGAILNGSAEVDGIKITCEPFFRFTVETEE